MYARCKCPTIDICENRNKMEIIYYDGSIEWFQYSLEWVQVEVKGAIFIYFYCLQALLFTPLFMYI